MKHSVARSILFALGTIALGELLGFAFHRFELGWMAEMSAENVVTGLVVGGVAYLYLEEKRRRTERRLEEIAYLNHHIRNALTAIQFAPYAENDAQRLQIIRDASTRIEGAVRNITEREHVSLSDSNDQTVP